MSGKKKDLDECGEAYEKLIDTSEVIYETVTKTKPKLIALNGELERLREEINFVTDSDLDHQELVEQKRVMINNINLEITKNKLSIVKVDAFLKEF